MAIANHTRKDKCGSKRDVKDNGACKATSDFGDKTKRETASWIYIPPVAKAAFTNPAISAPDAIK